LGSAAALLVLVGCETTLGPDIPGAPRDVTASYYARAVTVSWELAPDWDGETFRIYAKRATDAQYYLVAEVTSCAAGVCSYTDANIEAGRSYDYYVAAVSDTGDETASDSAVRVEVPSATPPPVPSGATVVALDHANFVTWDDNARNAADFSHYRVWLRAANGSEFLLGETDSEGFLDLRAENGITYSYFVTAVDNDGHESDGSALAAGTPRPDYHGEWIYAHEDVPALSGFRFQTDEGDLAIVDGNGATWDFRIESDGVQWWLRTGTGAAVHDNGGFITKALKCGVGADFDCTDVSVAPTTNYATGLFEMIPETTYVVRVNDGGQLYYGAIRVVFLGFDQSDAIMIFDWAFQLQAGNPNLVAPQGH
jgi:hypothetical protein